MTTERPILISGSDFERLQRLVDVYASGSNAEYAELLEQELARAQIRPQAPPDVVTMNSTVLFEDEETGERREATLCYPHETGGGSAKISVLAPVGIALLGLSVGQAIEWRVPNGRRTFKIVAVLQQPPNPSPSAPSQAAGTPHGTADLSPGSG